MRISKPCLNNGPLSCTFLAERYIKREIAIEVHFVTYRDTDRTYFVAIIQSAITDYFEIKRILSGNKSNTWDGSRHKGRRLMFIGIPQHIKDVESALAIRSTVRLFTDNPLFNLNGKAVNLGHVFNGVSSASVMELECKPIRCPPSLPKGAYQIIGDGPEVMDCISSAEPKNAEGLSPDFHLQINFNKILPFSCISGTMAYGPFARKASHSAINSSMRVHAQSSLLLAISMYFGLDLDRMVFLLRRLVYQCKLQRLFNRQRV